jgi:hypothetical protein
MLRGSVRRWSSWGWPGSWASELLLYLFPISAFAIPQSECLVHFVRFYAGSLGPARSSRSVSCDCRGGPGVISRRICISGGCSTSAGRGGTGHLV